jgi:glycosyltransferase involved in cell wall biosynthesis
MRILHLLNDVCDKGNGIVNTAVDLAIEQARQGHVVAVASAGQGYESLLEAAGVQHLILRPIARSPITLVLSMFALRVILADFRPTVAHAHVRAGVIMAWLWSKVYHFGLVGHVHNIYERESVIMGLADRVVAVSSSVAAMLEKQGIPRRKIRTVLNRTLGGLRQPPLANIDRKCLAGPSIVTVAGLYHRKGIGELIRAFEIACAQAPDAHLYLVGDGPDRHAFEEQARTSLVVERIHFEGFQKLPQSYMLGADIFVLASRRESFPLVLIEARAAGCAIVACDVDGIAEALDDGRAGILVAPQDEASLARALVGRARATWKRGARGNGSLHHKCASK